MLTTHTTLGVEPEAVLAVLAMHNRYAAYLKRDSQGELSGFRALQDEEIDGLVADGVIVVDARNLSLDEVSKLAYLNTLTPQPNAMNGPAGLDYRAPLEFWLPVMNACGARIFNADPLPLCTSMYTEEYASRLSEEGLTLVKDGPFAVPALVAFKPASDLIQGLGQLNMEARKVRDGEKTVQQMQNLVIGETIVAKYSGEGAEEALIRAGQKIADRLEYVDEMVAKVPVLKKSLPLSTLFEASKMVLESTTAKNRPVPRVSAPGLG